MLTFNNYAQVNAHLRAGPGEGDAILTTIPRGAVVSVFTEATKPAGKTSVSTPYFPPGTEDTWVYVSYGKLKGWVAANIGTEVYLASEKPKVINKTPKVINESKKASNESKKASNAASAKEPYSLPMLLASAAVLFLILAASKRSD